MDIRRDMPGTMESRAEPVRYSRAMPPGQQALFLQPPCRPGQQRALHVAFQRCAPVFGSVALASSCACAGRRGGAKGGDSPSTRIAAHLAPCG